MLLPCLQRPTPRSVNRSAFEPVLDLVGIRIFHRGSRNRNKKSCNMKQNDASLALDDKFGNIVREMAFLDLRPRREAKVDSAAGLVANRSEIALPAVRVARGLGARKYSSLQFGRRQFLPSLGRRSRHLHRSAAAEIKLSERGALIEIARALKCDAIYPGYGFLAENFTPSPSAAESRPDLHRSRQRLHRSHGRQSRGASKRGCRTAFPSSPAPNTATRRRRRPRRPAPRSVFLCC